MSKWLRIKIFCFNKFLILQGGLRIVFSYLFFNRKCSICSGRVYNYDLCPSCRKDFFAFPGVEDRCKTCGRVLVSEKDQCIDCRTDKVLLSTDGVFPLHSYRLWNKKLLFDWKMADLRSLSPIFAKAINKALRLVIASEESMDLSVENIFLVPVPPRKGKIRHKGWDQIRELCYYLNRLYGWKIFPALERVSRIQQKKLGREERFAEKGKNYALSRAFLRAKRKGNLPEKVFLIDDVITTGVTAESCSMILKAGGIKNVKVISLFIVD